MGYCICVSTQMIRHCGRDVNTNDTQATGLCLRGSRVPWRSGRGFEDGVGLSVCGID